MGGRGAYVYRALRLLDPFDGAGGDCTRLMEHAHGLGDGNLQVAADQTATTAACTLVGDKGCTPTSPWLVILHSSGRRSRRSC